LGSEDSKSSFFPGAKNPEIKGESIKHKSSDCDLTLPKILINQSINKNNYSNSKKLETKINHIAKREVGNFANIYAYKETLKIFNLPKSSEKFKKENYQANNQKINNMLNPFNHVEYSAGKKNYNMIRDNFKIHSEELLRFKHLERNDNKKISSL